MYQITICAIQTLVMSSKLSLGHLMSKYKTRDHFITAYKDKRKVLPLDMPFEWNYIRQVVSGVKLLIGESDLMGFKLPPR